MKIAQVAPLVESVPPTLYGGTERVVSWLTEELVRQGHDVTLFASGDSQTSARLEPVVPQGLRLQGIHNSVPYNLIMLDKVAMRQHEFDVLHFHIDFFHYPLFRSMASKTLTTLHGRQDLPELPDIYRAFPHMPLVSISDHQRLPVPSVNWRGTVHHGLPPALLKEGKGDGGYLAFLGRICADKGILSAIEIARGAGMPLKVAAKVDPADQGYFDQQVAPVLARSPHVEFIGEIGDRRKSEFLGGAKALLFPISWPEPFGLVMIESMACGTPVIAFDSGSVPEILEDGLTGFVVNSVDEAVAAVEKLDWLFRPTIRSRFEERFSVAAMARDYVRIYQKLAAPNHAVAVAAEYSERQGDEMEAKILPDMPEDVSTFHIQATESIQQRWPRTLKQGDTFALFDALGDCVSPGMTPGGVFHNDTRYLSDVLLLLDGQRPLLLSSTVENDNVVLTVDLSNPDIYQGNALVLPRESFHIRRSKFLWQGTCHERIAIRNFDTRPQKCWLTINFAADFADLFEIRGLQRAKRGITTGAVIGGAKTIYRYVGLDKIERRSEICFDPPPRKLSKSQALYALELEPDEQFTLVMTVRCTNSAMPREPVQEPFSEPYRAARRAAARAAGLGASVTSSNQLTNRMLQRAGADLSMLVTDTPQGPYPYAGTPWFSTPFGRDGLITALQILWIDPSLARGVLRYLAHHQATAIDESADAEPGKILHETRACEMAILGEVPFGHYYGSVDSTPLFVLLAARYFERSGDEETIRALWPNIEAALAWIDKYGDRDGDGFVEYYRVSENGLTNQGWKDSCDSIMHADGTLASGPIALCEVQGYVYAAKKGAAVLAAALGHDLRAAELAAAAEKLRAEFEAKFWLEDLGTYALALDGAKQPCRVKSSNAGQVLVCGIAAPERAQRVAAGLLTPEMFSGWGIRTLCADAPRFNPMSYHNGSVWPHDNALIAMGLSRYGLKRGASAIFEGLFDARSHMDMMRFPELFCGFPRRRGTAPVLYPVACAPQAWASVVPFALLQACMGLELDFAKREIRFHNPQLPKFLEEIRINDLELAGANVNLRLRRRGSHTEVAIVSQRGDIAIKITQ